MCLQKIPARLYALSREKQVLDAYNLNVVVKTRPTSAGKVYSGG